MTPEDEEFNRIEREAAMRKEAVRATVAPRKWVGLTVEEQAAIGREMAKTLPNCWIDFDYARAIEAKLREKNT